MNPFSAIGRWIGRTIKKIWQGNEFALLEEFKELALLICEKVSAQDLNKDGKIAAVAEIKEAALATGAKWGKPFLEDLGEIALLHLPTGDLRRWLAIARLTSTIVARYSARALPATRVLNLLIEVAVNLLEKGNDE